MRGPARRHLSLLPIWSWLPSVLCAAGPPRAPRPLPWTLSSGSFPGGTWLSTLRFAPALWFHNVCPSQPKFLTVPRPCCASSMPSHLLFCWLFSLAFKMQLSHFREAFFSHLVATLPSTCDSFNLLFSVLDRARCRQVQSRLHSVCLKVIKWCLSRISGDQESGLLV